METIMFTSFKRTTLTKLYLVPLLSNITASMTWSIAVPYALDLGATIVQVNLISIIWNTMSILLLIPFGVLSDRFGRKPMLLYPRIVMLIGTMIRAFATDPNHILFAAFVGGFAGGGIFPVLLSMIGDVAKRDELQEAISILFLFSGIGMTVGPLLCSYLLTLPNITKRNIYQIDVIAQVVTFFYLISQVGESKPKATDREKINYRKNIADLLRQSNIRGLIAMAFLFFFYNNIMGTYIPIFSRVDLAFSDAEIASLSTYRNLAITIIRFSAATLLVKAKPRSFLLTVLILGGTTGLSMPFARHYQSIILIQFISGISFGAVMVLGSTLIAKNSTQETRGVANSLYNIAQSVGSITTIITPLLVTTFGLISVFILGGATALAATLPTLLRTQEDETN
jgi:MFS family permease